MSLVMVQSGNDQQHQHLHKQLLTPSGHGPYTGTTELNSNGFYLSHEKRIRKSTSILDLFYYVFHSLHSQACFSSFYKYWNTTHTCHPNFWYMLFGHGPSSSVSTIWPKLDQCGPRTLNSLDRISLDRSS